MLASSSPRVLSDQEKEKLEKEAAVSEFKKEKLEREAKRNWDLFYKRNTDHFFKDRHWLTREFTALSTLNKEASSRTVLEVGCGVGNTIYPLLEECPNLFVFGCDISPRAIDLVKSHQSYSSDKVSAFVCDVTSDTLLDNVPAESLSLVTLIFVMSAICPEKMAQVIENISKVLRPGGSVLFRDYGLYDHAMMRFKSGHKIQEQFYVRQDGTRAFYFTTEDTAKLFEERGFETVFNNYESRETVNKKEGLSVPRIFVQSQFRKHTDPART